MTQQERIQQSNGSSRRVHRIHRRKLDILKVTARLFAERGYERTTLEMIADELGLSKPSLYYYVKSKEHDDPSARRGEHRPYAGSPV